MDNGCKFTLYEFDEYFRDLGFNSIAGVDEAGRGPLAGPVVAASVILKPSVNIKDVNDSKLLSEKKRQELAPLILEVALSSSVAIISNTMIDEINILKASLLAMKNSLNSLDIAPSICLIDGRDAPDVSFNCVPLIKGDRRSLAVACASIIAKVTRDTIMDTLHEKYPVYNFKKHKGYPTKEHYEAILKHGPCEYHRLTYKGVSHEVKENASLFLAKND